MSSEIEVEGIKQEGELAIPWDVEEWAFHEKSCYGQGSIIEKVRRKSKVHNWTSVKTWGSEQNLSLKCSSGEKGDFKLQKCKYGVRMDGAIIEDRILKHTSRYEENAGFNTFSP